MVLAWLRPGLFSLIFAVLGLYAPGCLERRDEPTASEDAPCAACHGDPGRSGSPLERAAPPRDLRGSWEPGHPGVGAHAEHLASTSHAVVACSECHLVPDRSDAPGHADSESPAEVVFGPLAQAGGRHPAYDPNARVCSDTACHRDADAVWTEPRSTARACGSCHGLPPPPPHPASEACSSCHGEVLDEDRAFVDPRLHVNGRVETSEGGCTDCHGQGESPAPPPDLSGDESPSSPGVGAHQAHLDGGGLGRAVECAECHPVPETVGDASHIDGPPVEVVLTGTAAAHGREPFFDADSGSCQQSYCHGPSPGAVSGSPDWTEVGPLGCDACHGLPPEPPHPPMQACGLCHGEVVTDALEILEPTRHVDGVVDVEVPDDCTACHGGATPAPPPDLLGERDPTSPGVGAHQAHLAGTDWARRVACDECHQVPEATLDEGHLDSALPADLVFSGAAAAFGGAPSYQDGSCRETSCHGGVFPGGHRSGGSLTEPRWTDVGGAPAECGACHGLPPPAPHPYGNLNPTCSACHENIDSDNRTFTRPDLHVDGVVTFTVD